MLGAPKKRAARGRPLRSMPVGAWRSIVGIDVLLDV
jgi:hypothetical protein